MPPYTQLKAKVPPSASTGRETPSSPSHASSSSKRKVMSSASTAPLPHAKLAKPTGTSTAVAHSSSPSRPTAATTTAGRSQPSRNPLQYHGKAHRYSEEETNWLVSYIQKPRIYGLLQGPSMLKYRVYEYITEQFNSRFHPVELTPRQITGKVAHIKRLFTEADNQRATLKMSRVPREERKRRITAMCPFYFELRKMWSTSWGTPCTFMRSDGSLMVVSDSESSDGAADEIDSESGDVAEENSDASSDIEEDTEQLLPVQDKEQKVLLGRGSRVPSTQNRQPSPKPPAQEIRRRQPQEQPRPLEQQREERQEKQEQMPPTVKEAQDTKDSIQREVAKNQECVVRVSGHSLELKLEIMRMKLDARQIQDQTELALAREKLDLEEKVLALERRRLELQIRDNTRRLAEIQAHKDKFDGALADFEEKYCFVNEAVARADAIMDRALRR